MSFRGKLALFFFLVVVVPLLSVAFVLFRLVDDSETGRADARLSSRQEVAINLTREVRARGALIAGDVADDPAVARALAGGDRAALVARLEALRRRSGASRIAIVSGGRTLADTGGAEAVFPALRDLTLSNGRAAGQLQVSVADAAPFAARVSRVTGLESAVAIGGRIAGATITGLAPDTLPQQRGELTAGDVDYRAASYTAPAFTQGASRVTVLEPA